MNSHIITFIAALWMQSNLSASELPGNIELGVSPAISSTNTETTPSIPLTSVYLVVSSRTDAEGQTHKVTKGVAFTFERSNTECILITAQHVVNDYSEINVYRLNDDLSFGNGYEAKVKWENENKDVAALTIRTKSDCTPISLSEETPRLGQRIFSFLHTPLQRGMVTSGTIGAIWNTELGPAVVCDMRAFPGHSGSPVLDIKGRLIGMILSKAESKNVSYTEALSANIIYAEAKKNKK